MRSYRVRYRSLCILPRHGSDPTRSDTKASAPFVRNGSDPFRFHTEAYTSSSGMDPTLSDPIPELIHYLPVRIRSYPIRSRSLYIFYQNVCDPTPSDTGVCTLYFGRGPTMSDPILKLIHPLPEGIRSYPIRYRTLNPFFRNGSDPVRSHTGAYSSSSELSPTISDPIPELIHYLPVRVRSSPIRGRSLYIVYRTVSDPI
jgi:hypothetical protein